MEEPAQMAVLEITAAAGSGFTLIVTEFELVQPFDPVSVTVYVVVEEGDTEGFAIVELKPPAELDQE